MNALIAEKPPSETLDALNEIERARTFSRLARASKREEASRLPVAASLLPYGLSLTSLLRP